MKKQAAASRAPLYIVLLSIHGLIRSHEFELGRDADTGGQTKYVVELARAMTERHIHRVLVTRKGRLAGIVTTMDMMRALIPGPKRKKTPARPARKHGRRR